MNEWSGAIGDMHRLMNGNSGQGATEMDVKVVGWARSSLSLSPSGYYFFHCIRSCVSEDKKQWDAVRILG